MHLSLFSLFKTAFIGSSETFRDTFFFFFSTLPFYSTPFHDVHYSPTVAVLLKRWSEKQWQVKLITLQVYVGPSYPYVIARQSRCL